jgi:hypothetical protein
MGLWPHLSFVHEKKHADQRLLGQESQKMKAGLYANIAAKRERIADGSKEKMRKPGAKGAPKAGAFKAAAKTAKPMKARK